MTLQLMPDWLYGFAPPGWWPNRPREPKFYSLNVLNLAPGAVNRTRVEQVFSKQHDVLVWGGCALVTQANSTTIHAPLSGIFSQVFLFQMANPAGNETYLGGGTVPIGLEFATPLENVFSVWQFMGKRPVYWPIPVPIAKGGSLLLDLVSTGAINKDIRFTFYTSLLYERESAA